MSPSAMRGPERAGLRIPRAQHVTVAICLLLALLSLISPADAAFLTFQNCLDSSLINSNPRQLQFVPYFFDARFNTTDPGKSLNITIYGNVTGQSVVGDYPPPDSPSWSDPNSTFGKIVDISPTNNKYTTLFQKYQFLTYAATDSPASQFCRSTVNDSCPLGPSFDGNSSDPYTLSAFTVAQDLNSSYAFGTISTTIRVRSGDVGAADLACISANITPNLGTSLSDLIRYLPVAVLVFVGAATALAAMYSPWGTSDPFKWTTNYGRDQDLLRLVTPGFGDCLQYIQFVFLTGSLSLNYPGYYRPAASNLAWSALLFNESFATHGPGFNALQDNLYVVNGTTGLQIMSQLIGVTSQRDLWASMAVWLAVLCGLAIVICQLAFIFRWAYFKISKNSEEDLRHKNGPLTGGMLVRVLYNYFLLPIVAISMFQLLIASKSRSYMVVVAVLLLFFIIIFAFWILYVLIRTKPRAMLFDDLPTLLLYGSLYNTYNDERALFAIIPVILTFMRGVAIGVVQGTGIAQIIILAICEVAFILTVHAFRPFSSPTHMNVMHTIFATVRLITILLMVAFMPSLGVQESSKGWVGYIILLLHALVLVFGFFLNSIQTMIEVFARLAGAGGDRQHGAQRGALISYGWRQLRNRQPNRSVQRPGSMTSDAMMLNNDAESKHFNPNSRTRSFSAGSRMMLGSNRMSTLSSIGDMASSPGVDSFMASSPTYGQSTTGLAGLAGRRISQADPYYRPPRARRATLETQAANAKGGARDSQISGEEGLQGYDDWPGNEDGDVTAGRDTVSPAFFRHQRAGSETEIGQAGPPTDYAVREVDFYYGVTRGPALSSVPTRKRKTGPADPMGPVSNASTWLQRLIGGKQKDKQKGFEVVRSSRAPPEMVKPPGEEEGEELQSSPTIHYPPYRDNPDAGPSGGIAEGAIPEAPKTKRRMPLDGPWDHDADEEPVAARSSSKPPILEPITRGPSLRVPFPEDDSSVPMTSDESPPPLPPQERYPLPSVPRKSSRRHSSRDIDLERDRPEMPDVHPGFETLTGGGGRPASLGQVRYGLTGSSVFLNREGEHRASTAEVVGDDERDSEGEGRE